MTELTQQQWRDLLEKEPLAIHAPLIDASKKPLPYHSKFTIGDLVVNRKIPYEVSRVIEIDRDTIRIEYPYGFEWVQESDLRFILGWREGFYPYTNLLEYCQDELDF